jgi:hypothetical protein
VTGANTVLQVFFELKDAGVFNGQVIDVHTMTGSMSRASALDPVQFGRP